MRRFYSVRSAVTGSFVAARFAGSRPPTIVISMLITIRITAAPAGSTARTESVPTRCAMIELIGNVSSTEMPTPIRPAQKPMMNVSALNTCEMLRFEAPSARRMPISFVRSSTEMCVMMPIMMQETMSETATKAIST